MPAKLDQTLDEILTTTRRGASGGNRRSSRRSAGRPATAAPIGGIQKHAKPARAAANKPTPAKAAAGTGDSKVIVSNLPKDVSEQQIKEYFVQSVGPIKRVEISYGPNSVSRGIANVTFSKPDGASKAFKKLNGLLVDSKPIKIEIVVGAAQAASVIPTVKTLAERTTQPKAQPKSAAANKHSAGVTKGAGAARGRGGKKGARSGRPAKKTAEELDSEMADYFVSANTATNTNGTTAGGNGDAPMDDEIL